MEIQVHHEAIEGTIKNQAVLSFLFEETPGKTNFAIDEWNVINMPNQKNTIVKDFFGSDFNVWKFLYPKDKVANPEPFNYYKYMGSITSPPCEENVVNFIYHKPIPLGETTLELIRDGLKDPSLKVGEHYENEDGSYRYFFWC